MDRIHGINRIKAKEVFVPRNILKMFLIAVFAAALSGCAAVPVIYAVGAAEREENAVRAEAALKPFIEFVEVEIDKTVTVSTLRGAKVFTTVLEDDMKTVKSAPSLREKEFGNAVTEETLHSLSVSGAKANVPAPEVFHIEVLYVEGRQPARDQYLPIWSGYKTTKGQTTEEQHLNRWRGIRKGADLRLTLRRDDAVLMKARGFWGGNAKADEIAGARQLAREVASEVIKKLSVSSVPSKDATAERGAAMALDK